MNKKSYRVKVDIGNPSETNIKVNLKNNVDELNILSLKLTQEEMYQSTNADFGVVVGRVIANDGVGVENARISVFIPIDENDKNNPNIVSIYPYNSPSDENSDGKRYNLLSRISELNEDGLYKPKQPVGSFPSKIELLANEVYLEVYEKYYKYNTVTNNYGDYILFGVPTGLQKIHMSVDVTDIGKYSMTPIDMIEGLGFSSAQFTEDKFNIKMQKRMDDLPHIEMQEIDVNVIPFWGDNKLSTIGISRLDFNIKARIHASAVIFGTIATMGENCYIGTPTVDRRSEGFKYLSPNTKNGVINTMTRDVRTLRTTNNIKFRVYSYKNTIPTNTIDNDINNKTNIVDTKKDIYELDEGEYSVYTDDDGFFLLTIPCNFDKKIINESGDMVSVDVDNTSGVFTKFRGMFTVEIPDDPRLPIYNMGGTYRGNDPVLLARGKLKFPQDSNWLSMDNTDELKKQSEVWRKKYFELEAGEIYSIAQMFPTINILEEARQYYNTLPTELITPDTLKVSGLLFKTGGINYLNEYEYNYNIYNDVDNLAGFDDVEEEEEEEEEDESIIKTYNYLFPYNKKIGDETYFGGQWINMFCVLPQFSYTNRHQDKRKFAVLSQLTGDNSRSGNYFFIDENKNKNHHLLGDTYGSLFYLKSNHFMTDIIKVEKADIVIFKNLTRSVDNYEVEERALRLGKINGINKDRYKKANQSGSTNKNTNLGYDDFPNDSPYAFTGMGRKSIISKLEELNIV